MHFADAVLIDITSGYEILIVNDCQHGPIRGNRRGVSPIQQLRKGVSPRDILFFCTLFGTLRRFAIAHPVNHTFGSLYYRLASFRQEFGQNRKVPHRILRTFRVGLNIDNVSLR